MNFIDFIKTKKKSIAFLFLSFGLVSTFSISAAIPQMRLFYKQYSEARIDLLVSVPSFAILLVMIANMLLSGHINERKLILTGLTVFTGFGIMPLFCKNYWFVLVTRFAMGIGTGMVNTRAVSIISRNFEGKARSRLLGYRGSIEALGNAVLTMAAGLLLGTGWGNVFWIYSVGVIILGLYLYGSGEEKAVADTPALPAGSRQKEKEMPESGHVTLSKKQMLLNLAAALLCLLLIGSNTVMTMRIPVIMLTYSLGTDVQAGMILSGMIIASIAAGFCYSLIKARLKSLFVICMLILSAVGMLGVCMTDRLFLLIPASLLFGASYSIVVTEMFSFVAEILPESRVNTGTTAVLLGCNIGAFSATYVMKLLTTITENPKAPVYLYAFIILGIASVLCVRFIRIYNNGIGDGSFFRN